MMNRIAIVFIVLSVLAGSIFVARSQSDPSSSLSHLSPGNAISGSDLFYDVQVPGVGGVKVTGTQFLSWVFGNVSGNCSSSISGVFSCTGGNATGIAAGTNISTSGTGTNVTINTVLTPTFTSITTTLASVTGWLTAAGVNMQTATIAGILNGSTANLTGNLTGTTGNFSGNLTSTTHQVPGFLTASGGAFQTITIAGNLTAGSGSFATSLTAGTIQATGFLTASGANFTTLTVTGLTPTGPNCLQETGGLLQASGTSCAGTTTNIAAGTNITTSGTVANVTVNVVATPSFTTVIATGNLTAATAQFAGFLTAGGASLSGLTIATETLSGNLTGTTGNFTSNLTATTGAFSGFLTATGTNFGTTTITSLGAGTQCVESVNGIITGTGSTCGTGQFSIAAGTNITTTGTANNIVVSVITSPTFTNLTASNVGSIAALTGSNLNFVSGTITTLTNTNHWTTNLTATIASVTGWLTASGVNLFTATIGNTLTMANGTTNSFGILDKGDGSLYFQSNIATSGSGAVKIVNYDGGTPRFQVSTVTDANGRLSFGLDASNNPQIGFGLGISGRDAFINRQATGTLGFGTTAQGIDASISAGTMTLGNLTPTGPNCLQETGGVVQATNAACGSGSGSTVKGGPILPSSEYLGGGSGLIFPNFYIPNTNTSGAGAFEGIGYIATTTIATATLQFNMPETIPTGNARLRILQMANASTGSVQYTVSDAVTSPSNSLGTVTLNFEGVTSVAQTVADQLIEKKILLTVTPTSNQIMSIVIGTTSGVAQTITYQPSIVWE